MAVLATTDSESSACRAEGLNKRARIASRRIAPVHGFQHFQALVTSKAHVLTRFSLGGLSIYALRAIGVYGPGKFCLNFNFNFHIELSSLSNLTGMLNELRTQRQYSGNKPVLSGQVLAP